MRLDAAERAAEFFQLAFVGEFLALGDLDEFQNFIHLIVQLFQRVGDERGVRDGLVNRGGFSRAEISGLDPLALRGSHARGWRGRTLLALLTRFTRFTLVAVARLTLFAWFAILTLWKFTRTHGRGALLGSLRRRLDEIFRRRFCGR